METTEKTKSSYPSQINTKTISCRIPTGDYVGFLQDAISKGITLNDWLLMRIYSKSLGKVAQIEEKAGLNEVYEYIMNGYETEETPEGILDVIKSLEESIRSNHIQMEFIEKKIKGKSDPNLSNIKAQILTLAQTKIKHQKDLKEFMSEVNELLSELE